ncbi:MAG: hypothetical protein LQ349_006110 [Xanthoria aureola]|nr:MAG: hypothetical protein LQ349_006110 [Xanthoria aureola]
MADKKDLDLDPKANKPSRSSRRSSSTKRGKLRAKATCEPPSRPYLDRLPPEVLDIICNELSDEDIPALRLQCRYLCKIASAHFLRCAFVRFKKTSIDSLVQLSSHPLLSQNVRTIIYEPNFLQRQSRQTWMKDWRKAVPSDKGISYTSRELRAAWQIYQRYLQEQEDLIAMDNACQDLRQAVQGFPNLRALHVNYLSGLWDCNSYVNAYGDSLCWDLYPGSSNQGPSGIEQMVSLINMLGTVDVNLASLRIGLLNWEFFRHFDPIHDKPKGTKRITQSLQDIKFVINTWSARGDADDENEPLSYLELDKCRTYLEQGFLGHVLSAAVDLQKLAIEFTNQIDFQYVVLDTHWPHLHTIDLDSVDTRQDDWFKFFELHAASLKCLTLASIKLLDGNWPDVLERMQQLLSLDEAHFHKCLSCVAPARTWDFSWPGHTTSEDDSVPENVTRWALDRFMVDGGVCPLRDERVRPRQYCF